jgi:hypothetical protein
MHDGRIRQRYTALTRDLKFKLQIPEKGEVSYTFVSHTPENKNAPDSVVKNIEFDRSLLTYWLKDTMKYLRE